MSTVAVNNDKLKNFLNSCFEPGTHHMGGDLLRIVRLVVPDLIGSVTNQVMIPSSYSRLSVQQNVRYPTRFQHR